MVQADRDAPDVATSLINSTPTDSQIYLALGDWLKTVLPPPFRIRQGQQNRTEPPPGPFCIMQMITTRLLATNGWTYTDSARVVSEMREVAIQVTAFGAGSGDALKQAAGLWRDLYATDWFRENLRSCAPVSAADPRQIGFVNAEKQYENTWSVDLKMQINYLRTIPNQQFAETVLITAAQADAAQE